MRLLKFVLVSISIVALLAGAAVAQTATPAPLPTPPLDPGVQSAKRGTGAPLAQIANNDTVNGTANSPGVNVFFLDGLARFQEVESVSGTANVGLGPRFNFNQCAGCHVAPAVGGTGPAVNPQFAGIGTCTTSVSSLSQAPQSPIETFTPGDTFTPIPTTAQKGVIACNSDNITPSFITKNGPTREARFPFFFNSNGTVNTNAPNGGVEDLFTVSGRPDGPTAAGCSLSQPAFANAVSTNNVIFRIPTPVFGLGLVELLDDSTLLNNRKENLTNSSNGSFNVAGQFNHNGNDGTITRFGWKAQNKSGHIFAGEAYNVEMGISNLLFPNDRPSPEEDNELQGGVGLPTECLNLAGIGYPEDASNASVTATAPETVEALALDDVSAFANFMRFLAPPNTGNVVDPTTGTTLTPTSTTVANGQALFDKVGCSVCHNATPGTTQVSQFTPASTGAGSLSKAPVNAFSDFELHDMGTTLADNVSQGDAGGDQFRTSPLWGVGQRIFLLHDGRTKDLLTAIADHSSSGSEATTVISNFNALTAAQKQDVLDFLRSL